MVFGVSCIGMVTANSTVFYEGKHRAFYYTVGSPQGTGLCPHGDRNRVKPEYGVDTVEDRDCDPNIRRI
jgi:hypothetical protein